jgi:hypothetical protein
MTSSVRNVQAVNLSWRTGQVLVWNDFRMAIFTSAFMSLHYHLRIRVHLPLLICHLLVFVRFLLLLVVSFFF